jgi:prolipoprotein diacylglyceryltransferase
VVYLKAAIIKLLSKFYLDYSTHALTSYFVFYNGGMSYPEGVLMIQALTDLIFTRIIPSSPATHQVIDNFIACLHGH